jgi:NADPH-dependent 2,4-dienoyl-CoA reductase/sulfur reductase-like enzyme/nitrite reductase/ring-hydroxylating ferredoxin subunit
MFAPMGGTQELKGPDLAVGIEIDRLRDGEVLLGHAHGEGVVLVKRGDECLAVGATCPHYSGPLGEGIVAGDTIRCPWHHARFDLKTGAAVGGPALNAIPCFDVVREGALVRVAGKREPAATKRPAQAPRSVAIVGSGAAATVLAETLRAEGYDGPITMIGEEGIPVDRPNLSKDYLAGTAPEEWMPIRDEAALRDRKIDLVTARATALDLAGKRVAVAGAADVAFDALVIATGASPIRLPISGADLPHVHVVRTLADSRRLIAGAATAKRAVVIGGGFIGLEVAGALRARNLEVTVVLREEVPLARVLGDALGKLVEAIHVEHGVTFVRDTPAAIDAAGVTLASGRRLDADVVVLGVGVKPNVALAEAAGLRVDNGVLVDEYLRAAPSVYAVGDVARFPWGPERTPIRVEHLVHAERMGFVAARNLLGHEEPFRFAPFFWSQHYDVPVNYVGAGPWDAVEIIGDPMKRDVLAAYRLRGRVVALASVYRDLENLRFEDLLERGDEAGIEALLAAARG